MLRGDHKGAPRNEEDKFPSQEKHFGKKRVTKGKGKGNHDSRPVDKARDTRGREAQEGVKEKSEKKDRKEGPLPMDIVISGCPSRGKVQ